MNWKVGDKAILAGPKTLKEFEGVIVTVDSPLERCSCPCGELGYWCTTDEGIRRHTLPDTLRSMS